MRTVDIKHTVYPRFPDIMDHDLLAQITAFDSEEQQFISQSTCDRQRYLKALYLKAMRDLGHSRFFPKNFRPVQLGHRMGLYLIEIAIGIAIGIEFCASVKLL